MGCTPSVHVSHDVVYCEDQGPQAHITTSAISTATSIQPSLRVTKRLSSTSLSISEVVSHIGRDHRESLTTEVRITRYQGGKRDSIIQTTTQAWVSSEEKEVQTEAPVATMEKV